MNQTNNAILILSKVCSHRLKSFNYCRVCKSTKTALWRRGPTGKRTLCNKCGLKYERKKAIKK